MTLSLDSSVLVDLLRDRLQVREAYGRAVASGDGLCVSSIVVHELSYGAEKSIDPLRKREEATRLLRELTSLPFDDLDAVEAGAIRFELWSSHDLTETADLLIAAQARRRGWPVVTSNIRHFGRVRGLTLIDWRVSSDPLSPGQVLERVARPA